MKLIFTLLLTCAITVCAEVTKIGAGIFVQPEGGGITLPIDITDTLRIEPTFEFSRSEEKDFNIPQDIIITEFSVGAGIFAKQSISDQFGAYYGVRLNYSYLSYEFSTPSSEAKYNGYEIIPTLGLEYNLSDKFSVGAESGWYFEYIDKDSAGHATDTGIDVRLLARYFF